jgi:glycosyltransferase involved in cell wall biosynthesis
LTKQGNNVPLLSIAIPTKNRYETLIPVIEALINNIIDDNFEIIIQDNSDDNEQITKWLSLCKNHKIKYFHNKEHLSVSENSNLAIENCNGEYVIFIGDDDFVSPHIINITKYLDRNGIDCLIYSPGYYWWSNVDFAKESHYHRKNAFWLPNKINSEFIQKESLKEFEFVLGRGGIYYYSLPRSYHGVVRKKVLDKIKNKTGTYVAGSCPDMALAISLALVLDRYYYIQYPVSICGASKKSTAGLNINDKHFGKLEDQVFLPKEISNKWDNRVPRVWSGFTIYAQAIYETLSAFKIKKNIDYNALYASIIIYEKNTAKYVYPMLFNNKEKNVKYFKLFYLLIRKYLGKLYLKYKEKQKKLDFSVLIIDNVNNCMQYLKKHPPILE